MDDIIEMNIFEEKIENKILKLENKFKNSQNKLRSEIHQVIGKNNTFVTEKVKRMETNGTIIKDRLILHEEKIKELSNYVDEFKGQGKNLMFLVYKMLEEKEKIRNEIQKMNQMILSLKTNENNNDIYSNYNYQTMSNNYKIEEVTTTTRTPTTLQRTKSTINNMTNGKKYLLDYNNNQCKYNTKTNEIKKALEKHPERKRNEISFKNSKKHQKKRKIERTSELSIKFDSGNEFNFEKDTLRYQISLYFQSIENDQKIEYIIDEDFYYIHPWNIVLHFFTKKSLKTMSLNEFNSLLQINPSYMMAKKYVESEKKFYVTFGITWLRDWNII